MIKRYDWVYENYDTVQKECDDGQFMYFTDHEKIVNELRDVLKRVFDDCSIDPGCVSHLTYGYVRKSLARLQTTTKEVEE